MLEAHKAEVNTRFDRVEKRLLTIEAYAHTSYEDLSSRIRKRHEGAARMRRQPNQTAERVSKVEKSPKGSVVKRPKDQASSSRRDLSTSEIRELWSKGIVEVRVLGLFRASGNGPAVAVVTTIAGFIVLVLQKIPIEVCFMEGALGAWLSWLITPRKNAKD